jgi:hypothetical protein
VGSQYLSTLGKHLRRLGKVSGHGNRLLRHDDLLTLLLLGFFNPTLRSLRTLENASVTAQFQPCLNIERACRSTLSDANACLDPKLLEPLIRDLRARVPNLPKTDRQLQTLFQRAIAVDGSLFSVAGDVAWALRKRKRGGKPGREDRHVRLDLRYCCCRGTIEGLEINGRGTSEVAAGEAED